MTEETKSWIPEISDERLAELSERIKPLVRNGDGELCYIRPVDLRGTAYTWSPKIIEKAGEMNVITDITTYHTYGYYGFFKPSIGEVLAQIPAEYVDRVVAFEIIKSPETADDLNREKAALNAGYHVATTRLYEAK
jgi:hypothetical protein